MKVAIYHTSIFVHYDHGSRSWMSSWNNASNSEAVDANEVDEVNKANASENIVGKVWKIRASHSHLDHNI